MKQFSNLYIFCFSSALVLIVAAALSFTSMSLQEKQKGNEEIERKQNILIALGVDVDKADVLAKFGQYIEEGGIVIDFNGDIVPDETADGINLKREQAKPVEQRLLPVYIAKEDGMIVIPVRGAGMWGPIWGNVALKSDMNTIHGVTFDHASETPGLGAEMAGEDFQSRFPARRLFDNRGNFQSITVQKPGRAIPDTDFHTVDGLSGGTVTSNRVEEMLRNSLSPYQTYLVNQRNNSN